GRVENVWLSTLAAAVLSSIKLSNAPFGLVWLAAVCPVASLVRRRPWTSAFVAIVALLASFVPGVVLNHRHCREWTGAAPEFPRTKSPRPAGFVFAVNSLNFAALNFAPPIFPWASRWNAWAKQQWPAAWLEQVHQVYGSQYCPTDLPEMHMEDGAG